MKIIMIKHIIFFLVVSIVWLTVSPLTNAVSAASLLFDPTSVSKNAEESFDVSVTVNAGSDQITSTDAVVSYDANVLEVQSIANGSFFPTVTKDTSQTGKVYIAGLVDDPATSKTGTGIVATITFKGKSAGSATLTFICTDGSTSDSNITKNDANATDIITCASNGTSAVTISGSGGSSSGGSSSGGSSSGGSSSSDTPAPTELPKSGILEDMLKYAAPGIVLLLLGSLTKLML